MAHSCSFVSLSTCVIPPPPAIRPRLIFWGDGGAAYRVIDAERGRAGLLVIDTDSPRPILL